MKIINNISIVNLTYKKLTITLFNKNTIKMNNQFKVYTQKLMILKED